MNETKITFDKFIRWAGVVAISLCSFFILNSLSGVLLPFFVAWLFAYLLYPLVCFVQYKCKVKVRALAILVSLLLVCLVIGGVIYLIIPPMIEQFTRLGKAMSTYISHEGSMNEATKWVQTWAINHNKEIISYFQSKDFTDTIRTTLPKLFSFLGQTASVVISVIASCITLLYMFFILLDYEYLTQNWIKIFPPKNRPFWSVLAKDVERELNNYIRGQSLVALCMGIMFCIGFTIIDFPMAIGLGILIGILDLVPYLHAFGVVPTAFFAILKASETGESFWWVFGMALLVFIVVQIITETIVIPKIMGKTMGLNPAILLLSLSVWGALLGFIGLIIALPLTTLIIAYWQRYITKEEKNEEFCKKNEK